MPDRLFGSRRRAAYVMMFLALFIIALAVWNIHLTQKVWHSESIRRSEEKATVARQQLACKVFFALEETAIEIPLQNLTTILQTDSLTAQERAARTKARQRYRNARILLEPALVGCTRPGPPGVRGLGP